MYRGAELKATRQNEDYQKKKCESRTIRPPPPQGISAKGFEILFQNIPKSCRNSGTFLMLLVTRIVHFSRAFDAFSSHLPASRPGLLHVNLAWLTATA